MGLFLDSTPMPSLSIAAIQGVCLRRYQTTRSIISCVFDNKIIIRLSAESSFVRASDYFIVPETLQAQC